MLNLYALLLASGENPLLRFEPGLMIWTVLSFFFLLVALYKIAWGPILKMLDERELKIDDALKQAEKVRAESASAAEETQRKIDEAVQQAQQIVQRAREEADESRRQILDDARAESQRSIDQGLQRLEAERRAALQEIRQTVADLAIRAAGRLIQSSLTERQQREVVERFLNELPGQSVQ
ncbi:MAG: F0F1 ATP synthase subunit B [Bryobacterales bacterium]|nr:F0F1 ATP synthase subunit B [Bryobacterales bacterium]